MEQLANSLEAICEAPFARMGAGFSDEARLAAVQAVHTAIYVVMAASTFVLLHAGITGQRGPLLWASLGLLGLEVVFFGGSGMRCPLTSVAVKYGAETGHVGDTFLPEAVTRYTFRFFGSVMAVGLGLLVLRLMGVIG
jgi:hypothetical protein